MLARASAALLLLLLALPAAADDYKAGVTSRVVLKTTTTVTGDKIAYPRDGEPEVTASVVEIPPGAETGWHGHTVPVYAWVVAGTLTVEYEGGKKVTLKPGDALVEAVGTSHDGRNDGSETVKLLVFTTGLAGRPGVLLRPRPTPAP